MNVLFAFLSHTFSLNLLPFAQIIVSIKSGVYHFLLSGQKYSFLVKLIALLK